MKYIEKDFISDAVVAYSGELRNAKLDAESLGCENSHPSASGGDVFDMVKSLHSFGGLKEQMFKDQGGICCYCGRRLFYPTHPQYIVEHVQPKEKHREFAGEYGNLLLSCRPSEEEEQQRGRAKRRERSKFFHCDKSKGADEIEVTPLQPDCQSRFLYDVFGEVQGADDAANRTLEVLNLNCDWLKKRRQAAIEGAMFDGDTLLSDDELRMLAAKVMDRDADGLHTEYCFAIASALSRFL